MRRGNLWHFGGEGIDGYGTTGQLNDLWKFDPTLGTTGQTRFESKDYLYSGSV
jgi:hypothetical protein